jgi:mRNA interferase MazF
LSSCHFPFSDLSNAKRRSAFVVAALGGDDVILCQITSQNRSDGYSVPISANDFTAGCLHHNSNIRPNRLFTADSRIIIRSVGKLSTQKTQQVVNKIIQIIQK